MQGGSSDASSQNLLRNAFLYINFSEGKKKNTYNIAIVKIIATLMHLVQIGDHLKESHPRVFLSVQNSKLN